MYRFFLLILCILFLSSCNDINEDLSTQPNVLSVVSMPDFICVDNGKYGVLDSDGTIIIPPIYNLSKSGEFFVLFDKENKNESIVVNNTGEILGSFSDFYLDKNCNPEEIYVAVDIEGKRKGISINSENGLQEYIDVDNTLYYFFSKNGELVFKEPVEDYLFFKEESESNNGQYDYFIATCKSGKRYCYKLINGQYCFLEQNSFFSTQNTYGYDIIQYYYSTEKAFYGLAKEGTWVFSPIYSRIEMPFDDRVVLWKGSTTSGGECVQIISDMVGNEYAQYNTIYFNFIENEYYLGIAVSYGDSAYSRCYDSNGNPLDAGYWFINKDGVPISKRFLSLSSDDEFLFEINSDSGTVKAVDENGNLINLPIKEYILKQ